jgi:type IV pilus assembly protein PilM
MLGFVQNWFAPKCNPIGVDFGSDCLRLAQVQRVTDAAGASEFRLVAAASADVPSHVRAHSAARLEFFVDTCRDLLSQGGFSARQAVLALPAASMFIQHLRLPRLDDTETAKALTWEASGKLPIDPSAALMRHLIAGEIYQDQEPRNEVILMAAAKELVNQFLAAAARAKLDVIGMNVEPKAVLDCFTQVYRRKTDAEMTTCYVDIGLVATRAVIARGGQILFARSIPVGGEHFNRAVAAAMSVSGDEAKMLRIKLANAQPALDEQRAKRAVPSEPPAAERRSDDGGFALLEAGLARDKMTRDNETVVATAPCPPVLLSACPEEGEAARVEHATTATRAKLVEELDLCRRYYEATFPNKPVDRLVFIGGEARQRGLCQYIARELGLAAQVGDPLVRMGRTSDVGIESGIDRRQPQPAWAVAIGLSMGPANG